MQWIEETHLLSLGHIALHMRVPGLYYMHYSLMRAVP